MNQYCLYFQQDKDSQIIPPASGSNFATTNLPNSPIRSSYLTVADRVLSFERLNRKGSAIPRFNMSIHKLEYDPLQQTRISLKSWVTRHCNNARESKNNETLTKDLLQSSEYSINEIIKKLEEN